MVSRRFRKTPDFASAFTLMELVIVVVVIGIVASIAISRVGAAAQNSLVATLKANLNILDTAAQIYAAEHDGRGPATEPDGTVDADSVWFVDRLTGNSDSTGTKLGAGFPFGPYLRAIPKNPVNGLDTVRIDGAAAGKNTHGWRFDSASGTFRADDSAASAAIAIDVLGNSPLTADSGAATTIDETP